jgi:DNA-binding CsgD family transcriptional regulator
MALLREIELRTAICEFSDPQGCTLLLDENLRLADLPEDTRRLLERFYGRAIEGLPPSIATWLKNTVLCDGCLPKVGGPWKFQQSMPIGRLECVACILPDLNARRFVLLRFTLHGCTADFSPLARIGLSRRELEVLTFLPLGYSNAQIASALEIGEVTVKKHLRNAGEKLGATGKTGILYAAIRRLRELESQTD